MEKQLFVSEGISVARAFFVKEECVPDVAFRKRRPLRLKNSLGFTLDATMTIGSTLAKNNFSCMRVVRLSKTLTKAVVHCSVVNHSICMLAIIHWIVCISWPASIFLWALLNITINQPHLATIHLSKQYTVRLRSEKVLGCAEMTKSFDFLPSIVFLEFDAWCWRHRQFHKPSQFLLQRSQV